MKRRLLISALLLACCLCGQKLCAQSLSDNFSAYVQQAEKEKKIEREKYNQACQACTLQAFEAFLREYPDSEYAPEVKNRIKEFELWQRVAGENTISAYENYLNTSQYLSFQKDANDSIANIRAEMEWAELEGTNSLDALRKFRDDYPNSPRHAEAERLEHELTAVGLCKGGYPIDAYYEFMQAGDALRPESRPYYDEAIDEHFYSLLGNDPDEMTMASFLRSRPDSKHYDEVSNRLALAKARKFGMNSTNYDYEEAKAYARDEATRSLVNNYAEASRRAQSNYKKELRNAERRENGGLFNACVQLVDLGFSVGGGYESTMYYDLGFGVRLGNYKTPVQIEAGLRPGLIFSGDDIYRISEYEYEDLDISTRFHMPIYGKCKINLWGNSAKLYISGSVFYNMVRSKLMEKKYAWEAGMGYQGKHWDWQILYFRKQFGEESATGFHHLYDFDPPMYIGTSAAFYFQF